MSPRRVSIVRSGRCSSADGRAVDYDRVVIATGVRNRPWPVPEEAALDGVASDPLEHRRSQLHALLADSPKRVLVIGGGFTGSEVASVCRQLGLDVTLVERGGTPLAGALGDVVGEIAADLQRAHGVDLRTGVEVAATRGRRPGPPGRAVRRHAGSTWTWSSWPSAPSATSSGCTARGWRPARSGSRPTPGAGPFDIDGLVTDDVFVAGDVARFPHPLYGYQFLSLEHWENAVAQARIVAHNMMCPPMRRLPHISVPSFWSIQFGVNIKSVGVPPVRRSDPVHSGLEGGPQPRRRVRATTAGSSPPCSSTRRSGSTSTGAQIEKAAPFPLDLPAVDDATPGRAAAGRLPRRRPTTRRRS